MSRPNTTSPNACIEDANTAQARADRPGPTTKSPFHAEVIAPEFFGPQMFDHDLSSEAAGERDAIVSKGSFADLDPHGRTIIMLPPRPRGPGMRRQTSVGIRPEAYWEPELPSLNETTGPASAVDAALPPARHELEDFFSGIESAQQPRRNWGQRFLGLFVSAWSYWRRERDISRSIAALSELDDRTLRDIGIHSRHQIPGVVRNARHGA